MRYYSSIAVDTALTAGITADEETLTVNSASGYPTDFPFTIVIDPDTLSEELVEVSDRAGTVFTVTRGFDSTVATSHGIGAVVKHVLSAEDLRESQEHIAATTDVHGIADTSVLVVDADIAGMVTETGTQTLTNKTINYDDNTITNLPAANLDLVLNAQTGTTYTLALSDKNKLVTLSNASAITVTVPLNSSVAFPTGSQVNMQQIGAGQVTVSGASGVTVNGTGTKLRAQWSAATLIKTATDTWSLVGDIA